MHSQRKLELKNLQMKVVVVSRIITFISMVSFTKYFLKQVSNQIN